MLIGNKIISFEELSSTNTYSIKMLTTDHPSEGTVIRTYFQTSGRGQTGNSWESEKGKNLLFSIILYPEMLGPGEQFIASMTLSLGIYDFVSRYAHGCSIKWPNDIYVKDDKIAGILIESSTMGDKILYMVAGIGINVNQNTFLSDAPNPVSLRQATGREFDLDASFSELLSDIDKRYWDLKNRRIFSLKKEYHSRLYRYGEWTQFADSSGVFTGTIKRVDNDGRLTIRKKTGGIKKYYFKEVEFIR